MSVIKVKVSADFDEFLKWCDETILVLERLKRLLRNIPDVGVSAHPEEKDAAAGKEVG